MRALLHSILHACVHILFVLLSCGHASLCPLYFGFDQGPLQCTQVEVVVGNRAAFGAPLRAPTKAPARGLSLTTECERCYSHARAGGTRALHLGAASVLRILARFDRAGGQQLTAKLSRDRETLRVPCSMREARSWSARGPEIRTEKARPRPPNFGDDEHQENNNNNASVQKRNGQPRPSTRPAPIFTIGGSLDRSRVGEIVHLAVPA